MDADYSITEMAFNPERGDERLHVQFYIHPKQNAAKSAAEGRPIFEDREYVRIVVPGDKDNIIERPANDIDRARFARQYDAFKRGASSEAVTGTPLSMWPQVTRAQVEELAYFKIHTVEQLAEISDGNAQNFLGMNSLRQKAKDFLAAAKDGSIVSKMREDLQERDSRIALLEDAIEKLKARLDELEE